MLKTKKAYIDMATNSPSQSQIDNFNRSLSSIVTSNNNGNPDSTESVSNPSPTTIGQAIDISHITPAQYSSFSGVDPTTAQQMYESANPQGRYSNQTIPGTQTTWSSLSSTPGMYDYVKSNSNQADENGNPLPNAQSPAQALATAVQNPNSIVENYLQSQIANLVVGASLGYLKQAGQDDATTNYKNAIAYLGQNGVSPNDIQTLTNNAIANGKNIAASQNANSGGGFVNNLVNSIASPAGIAAIVANTLLPGSGAFIPAISSVLSGKSPSASQLLNLAISQSGVGADLNSNIAGNLSDATGISSDVAKNIATGVLSAGGALASGKNIQDALIQGTTSGLSSVTGTQGSGSGAQPTETATTSPVTTSSSGEPTTLPPLSLSGSQVGTSAIDSGPSTPSPLSTLGSGSDTSNLYTLSTGTDGQGLTGPTGSSSDNGSLTSPTSPNLTSMGGGQGLTENTGDGTLSSLGLTPTDSQTVMGDPESFVNDASVTGKAQQTVDSLSKLDSTGNNVITNTADPVTGEVTSTTTPATLPNNPVSGLTDPTGSTSTSTGSGGLSVSNSSSGKSGKSGSSSSSGSSGSSGGSGSSSSSENSSSSYTSPTLSTAPSMLKAAPVYSQSPSHEEQLKQIYSSLTPELQGMLQQHGIVSGQDSSSQPVYEASGGSIDDQMMVKPIRTSPSMLGAAPTNEYYSSMGQKQLNRLGALKALYSSINSRPTNPFSQTMAKGGLPSKYEEASPDGHHPEFITGLTGYYASGGGTGQSDDIPAMLHQGDYVMDADAVAALGDGSSKAGAENLEKFRNQIPHHKGDPLGDPVPAQIADGEYVFPASFVSSLGGGDNKRGAKLLDKMREELREHKRSAPTNKIPPKAKSLTSYLKSAKG